MARYAEREHGKGSVRYDEQRQRWRGQVTVSGKRRSVSARTRGEVERRLDALLNGDDETGAGGEDGTSLGAWLVSWVEQADGCAETVANRKWAIAHLKALHAERSWRSPL